MRRYAPPAGCRPDQIQRPLGGSWHRGGVDDGAGSIRSIGSQQHGQGQRLAGGSARALNLFLKGAALLPSAESCCPKEYSGSISPGSGWDSCDPHASRARKGN